MGLLDALIGKKKASEDEELAREDMELVPSEEKYKQYVKDDSVPRDSGGNGTPASDRLGIEVDKLKAQVEALKEMRMMYEERFNKLNQDVGEAKAMILNTEKEMQDAKKKAELASALVQTVQPENLMKDLKLLEAKLGETRAYIEKVEGFQTKMKGEMSELRGKLETFRGLDAVKELSEEVKKDLYVIKKTQTLIEAHADKVGYIYLDFQKKFANMDQVFTSVTELKGVLAKITKDLELLKTKSTDYASRMELTTLKDDMKVKLETVDTYLKTLDQLHSEIDQYVDKKLDVEKRNLQETMTYIESYAKDIEKYQGTISTSITGAKEKLLEELENYQMEATKLHGELKLKFGQSHEELLKETTALRSELDDLRSIISRHTERQEFLGLQKEVNGRVGRLEDSVSKVSNMVDSVDSRLDRTIGDKLRESLKKSQHDSQADVERMAKQLEAQETRLKVLYSLLNNVPTKDDFSSLMDRYGSVGKFDRELRDLKSSLSLLEKQIQLSEEKLRRYVDLHYTELARPPSNKTIIKPVRSRDDVED